MNRFLTTRRLALLFFAIFGVLVGGLVLVQRFWVDPQEACERDGRWWYPEERRCLTPIYLPDITGRPEGVSREEASNAANRELLAIEERLAAESDARDAAIERQREELNR
jgi:hypothetical protein